MNFIKLTYWGQKETFFLAVASIATLVASETNRATIVSTLAGQNHKVEGSPATVMELILSAQAEAAIGVTAPVAREARTFAGEARNV